jgi:hypothetical protein
MYFITQIAKIKMRIGFYSTVIASVGHAVTHAIHKIQSSSLVGTALSLTKSNTTVGHISTQTPSPSHASETVTLGILFHLLLSA